MRRMPFFIFFFSAALCLNSCAKGPKPVATFTMDKNPALSGDTVAFANQSTDATTFSWDFGDDSVSAFESPTHVYQRVGIFPVTLNVQGEGGKNSTTQSITILPSLTGYWTTSYTMSYSSYKGSINLIQNCNNELTGTFELMEGMGYSPLLSSSIISGTSVIISISSGGYNFSIKGTINSGYDYITGNLFINDGFASNCYAIKKVKL